MIAERLIKSIKEQKEKRGLYVPKYINASSIFNCVRETYYKMSGIESVKKEMQYFTMEIGICLHEMLQKYSKGSSIKEQRINNEEFNLACRADDVIAVKEENAIYLIEYKVVNSRSFFSMVAPREAHIWQWQATSLITGIPLGELVYFLPDTATIDIKKFKIYHIEKDKRVQERIKKKATYLNTCLQKNIVPRKEAGKCMWCTYKEQCKGEDK